MSKSREKNNGIRTIACEGCGETITKRMQKGHRFCSPECAAKAPRPHRKTGEYHACGICNKEVYIPKYRLGKPVYFCSTEHANEWQGRNKIEYTCKTCNKSFRKSASFEKFGSVLYCSPQCAYNDPDRHAMLIALNAEQQKGNMTEPERIGYTILDGLQIAYLPQHLIGKKFCVDAFIPSVGLVIQFDGDYWHGHPERFPSPDARQRKRMRLDQSQDSYMKACGYTVLRIWECDLRSNTEKVKQAILHVLPPQFDLEAQPAD